MFRKKRLHLPVFPRRYAKLEWASRGSGIGGCGSDVGVGRLVVLVKKLSLDALF